VPEKLTDREADTALVMSTAARMTRKLREARTRADNPRGGWHRRDECSPDDLEALALEHIRRWQNGDAGQVIDIINLLAMLQDREAMVPLEPEDGYHVWTNDTDFVIARGPEEAARICAEHYGDDPEGWSQYKPDAWGRYSDDDMLHMKFDSLDDLRAFPKPHGAVLIEGEEDYTINPSMYATAGAWCQCIGPGFLFSTEW